MRLPGRKFDTWDFEDSGTLLKIPVRMIKHTTGYGGGTGQTTSIEYAVILPELGIDVRNKDVNELRTEVFGQLKGKYKVEWAEWIMVEFKHTDEVAVQAKRGEWELKHESNNDHKHESMEMELEWNTYEIGTRPDGSQCHKSDRGWGDSVVEGWPHERDHRMDDGGLHVMVPYTEENITALLCIRDELEAAMRHLWQFFTEKQLASTLKRATMGLLSAPEPLPDKPKKKMRMISKQKKN